MKNTLIALVVAALILVGGFYALNTYIYNEKQGESGNGKKGPAQSPADAIYVIDGEPVELVDGVHEKEAAPGSASKIVTKYFGNEVRTDLDGDGLEDTALLLTRDTGGSGTFYYVVAALKRDWGYEGSQALLLGDRIAPQTTEVSQNPMHKGVVVVNYADRNPGEPMTTKPSHGKSIWLKLDTQTMQFGEVVQNFEGEADPKKMTLSMKSWVWVSAMYNDGREVFPKKKEAFTLTFRSDGTFSVTTDCNSMSGTYVAAGGKLAFGPIAMTKMYCEGSQEGDFAKLLENTALFHFTSNGQMILDLKFDSGTVIFR